MRYCETCAQLHGWPFEPVADSGRYRCETCGGAFRPCNESDALLAPRDKLTDAQVVELLLSDLRAEVRNDWKEFVTAAGELAAVGCRYEAWAALGGKTDAAGWNLDRLRGEANGRYVSWARRLRTVAVLARVLRELGGTP